MYLKNKKIWNVEQVFLINFFHKKCHEVTPVVTHEVTAVVMKYTPVVTACFYVNTALYFVPDITTGCLSRDTTFLKTSHL